MAMNGFLPPNPLIQMIDFLRIVGAVISGNVGRRLLKSAQTSSATSAEIYKVPAGKKIKITAAWAHQSTATGTQRYWVEVLDRAGNTVGILVETSTDGSIATQPATISFPSPVTLTEGESVVVKTASSNSLTRGGIIGWEEG